MLESNFNRERSNLANRSVAPSFFKVGIEILYQSDGILISSFFPILSIMIRSVSGMFTLFVTMSTLRGSSVVILRESIILYC